MEKPLMKSLNSVKPHHSERKWISIFSLVLGVLILSIKFYAYHKTNSQSIFSDALESIVNVVAGAITIAVIIAAAKPADAEHPYGHGKLESMAATFEGGAITLAGVLIVIQSIQIFFHGAEVSEIEFGLILTIVAGLLNGVMGFVLKKRGERFHSDALVSSGTHLLGDALTSIGVIVSLLVVKITGLAWVDPIIATLFGAMLCFSGAKILIRSGNVLMDAHDDETLKGIAKLFEKHYQPGVIDIHYTRVIRSGPFHHIDCHLVIPEFWSVAEAHDFSEHYELSIVKDYPIEAEFHFHLDPCRQKYCEKCEVSNCPIRKKEFIKRHAFNDLKMIASPGAVI